MKKIIALLLAVLLLSLMLIGCVDKDKNEETAQPPLPTVKQNGENDSSNTQAQTADTQQESGSDESNAPIQTTQDQTAQTDPAQPDAPATEPAPMQTTEALSGLDVEEDYTVEIGPGQGVGGN